jgi:lipid A disaccharide synthetase
MKSQALQELVKNIFGDEKTKSEFMSNPDSVLAQFNLTEQEKKAVLNTHAKVGLVTSGSQQLEAALAPSWTWTAPTP